MSNRVYTILLTIAVAALVIVLLASYFMNRLTLSPESWLLLLVLVGFPLSFAIRSFPLLWLPKKLPPEFQARMAEYRREQNQSRLPFQISLACFLVSFGWLGATAYFIPSGIVSNLFQIFLLIWLGLFMFGFFGLIYTSPWLQTRGILFALSGVPLIILSVFPVLALADHPNWPGSIVAVSLCLLFSGIFILMLPLLTRFLRAWGQIN